jgi:hypothetical protein
MTSWWLMDCFLALGFCAFTLIFQAMTVVTAITAYRAVVKLF